MTTIKQLNKENPEKYIMVSDNNGLAIYIAPLKDLTIQITDKKEDSQLWSYADILSDMKVRFHAASTGLKDLRWERV